MSVRERRGVGTVSKQEAKAFLSIFHLRGCGALRFLILALFFAMLCIMAVGPKPAGASASAFETIRERPYSPAQNLRSFRFQHVYLGGRTIPEFLSKTVQSNHDAVGLAELIFASPDVVFSGAGQHLHSLSLIKVGGDLPDNLLTPNPSSNSEQVLTVTYTPTGGQFTVFTPDEYGLSGEVTSSFTVTGTVEQIYEKIEYILFSADQDYEGEATITATSTDSLVTIADGMIQSIVPTSPVSRTLTIPVTRYPDELYSGQYKDSIHSLKQNGEYSDSVALLGSTTTSFVATEQAGAGVLAADEDVRNGIKWHTLNPLKKDYVGDSDGNKKLIDGTKVSGTFYEVFTVGGKKIILFEADSFIIQPAATQKNKAYKEGDISFNCHGHALLGVDVTVKGRTYKFAIIEDRDVKTLLNDAYTKLTPKQAYDGIAVDLVYVLYYKNGRAIHSCRRNGAFSTRRGGTELLPQFCHVITKNGYELLNDTATLADVMKKFPETTKIEIWAPMP